MNNKVLFILSAFDFLISITFAISSDASTLTTKFTSNMIKKVWMTGHDEDRKYITTNILLFTYFETVSARLSIYQNLYAHSLQSANIMIETVT